MEPRFDEKTDGWLGLFAGDHYEKICDWLACAADLDKSLCALYLSGAPGTGKTLFHKALARLWTTGGPAELDRVLENINEELARCMVVEGDESVPKSWKGSPITQKIRSLITEKTRSLNRKYKPTIDLVGYIRLVLTANGPYLLSTKDVSNAEDLAAIGERFFYIEAPREAAELLKEYKRKDNECVQSWVSHDLFARHALWLKANRTVKPAGRFWVEGDVSRMHRLLVTSSDWNSWCCEWLVRGLLDGFRKNEFKVETKGRVVIRHATLFVNTTAISDGWQAYVNYPHIAPDPRKIASALRSISKSDKTVQLRPTMFRYFEIDILHLVSWANEHGVCSAEELAQAFQAGVKEAPQVAA